MNLAHQVSDWVVALRGILAGCAKVRADWRLEGEFPLWALTDERSRGRGPAANRQLTDPARAGRDRVPVPRPRDYSRSRACLSIE